MENNMKRGTLYAVGVGPGKAGHLTLLAAETLRACPVIAAPRTGGGHMLALEIAQKAVPLADKTVLPLDFAMKRGEAERESAYAAAERALCAVLDAGQDTALVNLGDVSIYASGQYLLERIRQKGYAAVMVPGIPSFCAAAARLGDTGRILVRESGTEPVLRVMAEAPEDAVCRQCVTEIVDMIRRKGHCAQ